MLVDSHCHIDCCDLTPFDNKVEHLLAQAKEHDVEHMLCVCIDLEHFPAVLQLAETYPQISASLGLHPNEREGREATKEELLQLGANPKVVAIGETGLDYFRSEGDLSWQHERFRTHIAVAKALQKPLIIHTRDAREDTIRIMREEKAQDAGGVLHCFTESWEMAEQALALGFYISFSGIVTFKNAIALQDVAKRVPLDRMLIETDAPYLAPVPFRGKSNVPAYVKYVAAFIAKLRGLSYEEIAQQTTENYHRLF